MNQLTEDDPLTIPCEFCDNGYYDNGGNDVKCDHCKGSGELTSGYEHEHFIHRYLGNSGFPPNNEVECNCGITGIVWLNGKTTWIGKNESTK